MNGNLQSTGRAWGSVYIATETMAMRGRELCIRLLKAERPDLSVDVPLARCEFQEGRWAVQGNAEFVLPARGVLAL